MVHILPDESLLTKSAAKALSYPELAALAQRANAGDASAAIAFDLLPEAEKRLAAELVKVYGKPVTKSRKPKSVVPKVPKRVAKAMKRKPATPDQMLNRQLAGWLNSDDPADRETAREVLRSRGVYG